MNGRERLRRTRREIKAVHRLISRTRVTVDERIRIPRGTHKRLAGAFHRFNLNNAERFFRTGGPECIRSRCPGPGTEDAVHEVLSNLLGSEGRLWASSLSGYVYTSVRRALAHGNREATTESEAEPLDPSVDIVDELEPTSMTFALVSIWVQLDTERADALTLAVLGKRRRGDCAVAMKTEPAAWRARTCRARAKYERFVQTTILPLRLERADADRATLRALLDQGRRRLSSVTELPAPARRLFAEAVDRLMANLPELTPGVPDAVMTYPLEIPRNVPGDGPSGGGTSTSGRKECTR